MLSLLFLPSIIFCVQDAWHCSQKYAELFDRKRGYGASAAKVIQLLRDGGDYRTTGRAFFPEVRSITVAEVQ